MNHLQGWENSSKAAKQSKARFSKAAKDCIAMEGCKGGIPKAVEGVKIAIMTHNCKPKSKMGRNQNFHTLCNVGDPAEAGIKLLISLGDCWTLW